MSITTNVVSRSGEMYSIQQFMVKGQWLAAGRCFFPGTPVSSTNETERHEITEIFLKVALNTSTLTRNMFSKHWGRTMTYR